MRFRRLYIPFVVILFTVLFTLCITFLSYNYDAFIRKAVEISQKPYLEGILRNRLLTTNKFFLLRKACVILLILIPFASFLLIRYRYNIFRFCIVIWQSLWWGIQAIISVFLQNTRKENIIILITLLIVVLRSGYYIINRDLQYDEMWSYNYFTIQPFYYPLVVSSNYPLYEVSTQLFKWLPFDAKIDLRLPVLITGLLSCVVFYTCLRRWLGSHLVAWCGMVIYAFMPVTTFFMLYARGVVFALFFSIIAIFSVVFWLRNNQQKRYLILFAIADAAGFYSMPTYLYLWFLLFAGLLITCFTKYRSQIHSVIMVNLGAAVAGFLLYLPFIAGSGLSFLLDATTSGSNEPISLQDKAMSSIV